MLVLYGTALILNNMAIKQHQIKYINPNELKAYAYNAKIHTESQIKQIEKSIMEFGFLDPVAYDEDYEILEGHGRILAALNLELKTIPAFQITGLTEAEKRAYRIAHNKLTMNTDFDLELLKIEFEFLSESEFDLGLTGFESQDFSYYTDRDDEETEYEQGANPKKGKEIDVDTFEFDTRCPKCGFEFNK